MSDTLTLTQHVSQQDELEQRLFQNYQEAFAVFVAHNAARYRDAAFGAWDAYVAAAFPNPRLRAAITDPRLLGSRGARK